MPLRSQCVFDWRRGNPSSAHTNHWSSVRITDFKIANRTGICPLACHQARRHYRTSSFLPQLDSHSAKRNLIYLWEGTTNCCSLRLVTATCLTLTHQLSPVGHIRSWWVLLLLLWIQWPVPVSHIFARSLSRRAEPALSSEDNLWTPWWFTGITQTHSKWRTWRCFLKIQGQIVLPHVLLSPLSCEEVLDSVHSR